MKALRCFETSETNLQRHSIASQATGIPSSTAVRTLRSRKKERGGGQKRNMHAGARVGFQRVSLTWTMILPVALCGSLTLKEQRQCSRMWCRGKYLCLAGRKWQDIGKKLNNEEPRDFYCASDNIRFVKTKEKEMGSRVSCVERERRNSYRILVRKPEGKRLGAWPSRRWEDTIKMDLK